MIDIQINKKITTKTNVLSGGPISIYEWKLDDITQINNTDTLTIPPNTLSLGTHTIKFRGQNYCGNWSSELVENINITEVNNMVTITQTMTVDSPTETINIVLPVTSTVTVIVNDPAGSPISGASVVVGTMAAVTTDVTGTAIITGVAYGTQDVTVSK